VFGKEASIYGARSFRAPVFINISCRSDDIVELLPKIRTDG
jgi:hypothetical protein